MQHEPACFKTTSVPCVLARVFPFLVAMLTVSLDDDVLAKHMEFVTPGTIVTLLQGETAVTLQFGHAWIAWQDLSISESEDFFTQDPSLRGCIRHLG